MEKKCLEDACHRSRKLPACGDRRGPQAGSLWLRVPIFLLVFFGLQSIHAQNWVQRGLNNKTKEFKGGEFPSDKEEEGDRRGKVTIRRIQPLAKYIDWDTDPSAIPYLLYQINKRTRIFCLKIDR